MQQRDNGVTIDIVVEDETGTARAAEQVARAAVPGDVIALRGDLGSGKTAFARGFIRALTSPDEEVPSPTFTLVQTYAADAATIHHFDFYRIEDPEEAWEIGVEEAFAGGIALIEWPERIGRLLPADRLDVRLEIPRGDGENARRITLTAAGSWSDRVEALRAGMTKESDG
ncbi:MAG: tRNA (adenosine(37)-N6)-threonylcarbamoyltransferase complex ATPase subunit type 1 TsaE [Gammaproteobacteria bacterium]|jgi:tRNA threonylcarbamoyladenosine biosynthesis protein TsaE